MFCNNVLAQASHFIHEQRMKDLKDLQKDHAIVGTAAESLKFNSRNADQVAYIATISSVVAKQINSVNTVKAELEKNKKADEYQKIDTFA